jgi:Flp pilus assembly protein CpaB
MNYTLRNLLVAAVLMMIGIVLVTSFIRGERRSLSRGKQQVQVYVAAKDIPEGTPAKELQSGGFVESRDMTREDVPPQALGKLSSVASLVSNQTVYTGEVVSMTAFDRTAGLKPTAQVKGNERLVSIPIPAANDIGSHVRPGDHVDFMASRPMSTAAGSTMETRVYARDIEVMETPTSLAPEGDDSTTKDAPDAEGNTKLYVIKATDAEIQNILFGLSSADENKFFMLLRGSSGDTQTKLAPLNAPDPSVN